MSTTINYFNKKSVLVTGHTGFKGSWLSSCLSQMGANIIGISDKIPTQPAHFDIINKSIDEKLKNTFNPCDILQKTPRLSGSVRA